MGAARVLTMVWSVWSTGMMVHRSSHIPSAVAWTVFAACLVCAQKPPHDVDVSSSQWLANAQPLPAPPSTHDAYAEVEYGASLFQVGKVTASVKAFDTAMEWDHTVNGTLWQRGCSMFYTEQLNQSAAQFALDVAGNPNDTEESIWRWLSQARARGPIVGPPYATAHILNTRGETRPYMIQIYEMYQSGTAVSENAVRALCESSDPQSAFYADMYYGLYTEQHGNNTAAQMHLHRAGLSHYGTQSGDYMWWLTRVHNAVRGWPIHATAFQT